jgi:F-type H+-transporting ATPase subunit a
MQILQQFAAENSPHVSLAADELANVGGWLPVTNAIILGLIGYIIVIWVLYATSRTVAKGKKRNFLVKLVLWAYEGLYSTVENVVGDKEVARKFAPLPITMFFFVIVQYYLGVLPFVGPIMIDGVPLFRGFAADLNTTFGLAILMIVTAQIYAIKVHGFFGNAGRYFRNPFKDPAGAFEGILEIFAEFSRTVALSLRLFGNVFAGEVLLVMIAFLTQYAAVVALPPFYIFELFIGGIQAYIFFMLTTVFVSLGMTKHDHGEAHEPAHSTPDTTASPKLQASRGE